MNYIIKPTEEQRSKIIELLNDGYVFDIYASITAYTVGGNGVVLTNGLLGEDIIVWLFEDNGKITQLHA